MPKHIIRLILVFAVFGLVAVTIRNLVVDKSFYRYGHYRGDAVSEIARDKPKFQGTAYCTSCHAAESAKWTSSIHHDVAAGKVVKCEVCHGPGGERTPAAGYINETTGPTHPQNLKLAVPTDTRFLCTACHEHITGRPAQQPQIVVQDHAGTQQCTLCHDPHSPLQFKGGLVAVSATGNAAGGKAKTAACAACHGPDGVGNASLPGPTLAGQNPAYLFAALNAYKSGGRKNPIMSGMAASVAAGDITDIAAYYAGKKCVAGPDSDERLALARKAGAAMCTNCHGMNGASTDAAWPNLAGQSKDYIASALHAYASGERSSTIMSTIAKSLNNRDVANISAYYAAAACKQ